MNVNHIQGLHAITQQLIDQGRMPIPDVMQKYLANSRAQLRAVQKKLGEAELPASGNTAMAQLLSDCQDVICHSVFLDDKAHLTLMDRINVAVAQLSQ